MGLRRFLQRAKWDRERNEELESYLQIAKDENIARGMRLHEASEAARKKLGNRTLIREEIQKLLDADGSDFTRRAQRLQQGASVALRAVDAKDKDALLLGLD